MHTTFIYLVKSSDLGTKVTKVGVPGVIPVTKVIKVRVLQSYSSPNLNNLINQELAPDPNLSNLSAAIFDFSKVFHKSLYINVIYKV